MKKAIHEVAADPATRDKLLAENIRDTRGKAFYEAAFKHNLMDSGVVSKLVSLRSTTDAKADTAWIDDGEPMPESTCSYTAPRAGDLPELVELADGDRVVLITYNVRNWNNYPDLGVIVAWSDSEVAEYLPFEYFNEHYGITEEEWADPAGKLFGKKPPFQHTYE